MALLFILFAYVTTGGAAFNPLTLEQKAADADLIVVGTTVSVTRLLPDDTDGSVEADDASYMGPRFASNGVVTIASAAVPRRPRIAETAIRGLADLVLWDDQIDADAATGDNRGRGDSPTGENTLV